MSRNKAKNEIELAFGFKQVSFLLMFTALVLGGTFVWGLEAGHRRAARGQPSVLAFLEKSADPHTEPVAIPSVLLEQSTEDRSKEKAADPASSRTGGPAPSARVKPRPAVRPAADAPRSTPAPAPAPPDEAARHAIHFQVAALGLRTNAKSLVDWLRGEGFPARILPARSDGLYRVYVGPFRDDSEAASARAKLAKNGFNPLVRKF